MTHIGDHRDLKVLVAGFCEILLTQSSAFRSGLQQIACTKDCLALGRAGPDNAVSSRRSAAGAA